jgi:divalent metal cation (Fe/Co/Zn/Cd) transporter
VWWRFSYEAAGKLEEHAERAEAAASRATGALLLLLGGYLVFESGRRLMGFGREPETSGVGIILTAVSLVVMPVLARAKLRTAGRLGSGSLRADAYESIACAWLSVTTLAGLLLNAGFGWWWADPLAAFALVPLIVREGLEGVKGEAEEER